jgi:hypothetical protein
VIPGYGAHRDGERRCGRRSTVGSYRREGSGYPRDLRDAEWARLANQVGYDAGKQVKGRKIHALVDTEGLAMRVVVHSAAIQDRDGAGLVLDKIRSPPWLELGRWGLQRLAG